uniref:(northern house mosquito) hypothetical protein n=1 Tax=Culex pipiens TaxID=7175 RepID=A0A8D8PGV9_CULPI
MNRVDAARIRVELVKQPEVAHVHGPKRCQRPILLAARILLRRPEVLLAVRPRRLLRQRTVPLPRLAILVQIAVRVRTVGLVHHRHIGHIFRHGILRFRHLRRLLHHLNLLQLGLQLRQHRLLVLVVRVQHNHVLVIRRILPLTTHRRFL